MILHPSLGTPVAIDILDILSQEKNSVELLRKAVFTHGCVLVKNCDLSPVDMQQLASTFGNLLELPRGFAFDNNTDVKGVIKVSNIDKNGEIIQNHKGAEYWHGDGNFWHGEQYRIWNFLHSKTLPSEGGSTGFCCGKTAYQMLTDDEKYLAQQLDVVIDPLKISDFDKNESKSYEKARHPMVDLKHKGGQPILYLGSAASSLDWKKSIVTRDDSIDLEKFRTQIMDKMTNENNCYYHKWSQGDLLIWDNTMGLHRSMGGYGNSPRLLYRSQSRIDYQ